VLVRGDRVLADSADIVEEASAEAPPERRLFPDDPAAAAEVRALQLDFDTNLGPHGRRWMYHGLRDRRDIAIEYACAAVPAWQRRALPVLYPVAARVINRVLEITPSTAAQSEAEVHRIFDEVGERLRDGRPYLCGERFTAADLTFSALAASVLMPPEHGVPLPQPEELPGHERRLAAAKSLSARRRQPAAEREGFEPSRELAPPTRLAGECLQPLGHLSGGRNLSVASPAPGG
jgi:glutathione S-transferase